MLLSYYWTVISALICMITLWTQCSSSISDGREVDQYDLILHANEAADLQARVPTSPKYAGHFSRSEIAECEAERMAWLALPQVAQENQIVHFKNYQILSLTRFHCRSTDFIRARLSRGPYYFNVFYNLNGLVIHIEAVYSNS